MKKGKGDKRSKSPSREKYEKENPTVSARLPKKTRDGLRSNLPKLGMSLTDALMVLAGDIELKVVPIDEARQVSYEEAKNLYMVPYPCSVCGEQMAITSKKAKEAVREFMIRHGWGHAKCHKQKRPQ